MTISFKTHEITVHRAPVVTERGVQVANWDQAVTHTVAGCRVQAGDGADVTQGATANVRRDGVQIIGWVDAPMDANILASDRIEHWLLGPDPLDIEGPIRRVASPSGDLDHLEINLTTVRG